MAAEIERHGFTLVHPFNDWNVIAGQGTAAWELLEQAGPLDVVICPVGGGGLLAGTALAVKGRSPRTRVIAAEPANADDARRSLEAGSIQHCDDPRTIADGLRTTSIGERNFAVIARRVEPDRGRDRGRDRRCHAVHLGAGQDRGRAVGRRRRRAAVDGQDRRPADCASASS